MKQASRFKRIERDVIARGVFTSVKDLAQKRDVQQRFFPCKLPDINGLDYYGESQPVGEVGWDFFDFISVALLRSYSQLAMSPAKVYLPR
jgi:serine phosphatase RsbU (regulator of sigma subunit)